MLPVLSEELWLAGFAKHLINVQPRVSREVAYEVAELAWPALMMLKPEAAVTTFLVTTKKLLTESQEANRDDEVR